MQFPNVHNSDRPLKYRSIQTPLKNSSKVHSCHECKDTMKLNYIALDSFFCLPSNAMALNRRAPSHVLSKCLGLNDLCHLLGSTVPTQPSRNFGSKAVSVQCLIRPCFLRTHSLDPLYCYKTSHAEADPST